MKNQITDEYGILGQCGYCGTMKIKEIHRTTFHDLDKEITSCSNLHCEILHSEYVSELKNKYYIKVAHENPLKASFIPKIKNIIRTMMDEKDIYTKNSTNKLKNKKN